MSLLGPWLSVQLRGGQPLSLTISSEGFPVKVGVVAPQVLGPHSFLVSSIWPPDSTNFQL